MTTAEVYEFGACVFHATERRLARGQRLIALTLLSLAGQSEARVTMRVLLVVALVTGTITAQSRGPLELANAAVPAGALRVAYGNDPLQFGELRVPTTKGPHPVAIVVGA